MAAYSTLGWFDDPLLDTFLFRRPDRLAELLFHELAHRRVFVPGDTLFNESFATAVAGEGVRRWLQARGETDLLARREVEDARRQAVIGLLLGVRDPLAALYADTLPEEAMRRQKDELLAGVQQQYRVLRGEWGADAGYDAWMAGGLNNAKLNTVGLYHRLVPAFRALLASHGGDLGAFYAEVEALAGYSQEARHARLEELVSLWGGSPLPVAVGLGPALARHAE